jgi:putative tricarboxylic transport membrane protein
MPKYDRMSSLFWLCLALIICYESVRLGPGTFSVPGPGFLPLACGLFLGILSVALYVSTLKVSSGESQIKTIWEQGTDWEKMILTVVSLVVYAFFMEVLGFRLSTFLWMFFICWKVGKTGWKPAMFTALMTVLVACGLFEFGLGLRFPSSILGFLFAGF